MGMTVQATELMIDTLIVLLTYFTIIPIIGCFRAWVAEKMGDDTPEKLGFLTLNPMAHVSFFWLAIMALGLTPFGFGQYIPLNPHNFYGKWRVAKMFTAYLSDAFANIVMALLALFCFVLLFGSDPLEFFLSFSQARTAVLYPGYEATSSFAIVVALLLRNIIFFNSMLAAFNMIVNLFYVGFFYFSKDEQGAFGLYSGDRLQWVMFIVPIILLMLFVNKIHMGILWLIISIGMWFWKCITFLS
jgi:hypothetical protein